MINYKVSEFNEPIPEAVIKDQIQRILRSPLFIVSNIFQSFLKYIVLETLSGRAKDIKEYNIALNVLKKPIGFDASKSGIVRVHAVRLRMALEKYYAESRSKNDICVISIPKGRYVPAFKLYNKTDNRVTRELISGNNDNKYNKVKLTILPFSTFENDISRIAFTNGIGLVLTSELAKMKNLSIISYFTSQHVKAKQLGISYLVSEYGIHYAVSGTVQFEFSKVWVSYQIINADSEIHLYSDTYSLQFNSANIFGQVNEIVSSIIRSLVDFIESNVNQKLENSACSKISVLTKNQFLRSHKIG